MESFPSKWRAVRDSDGGEGRDRRGKSMSSYTEIKDYSSWTRNAKTLVDDGNLPPVVKLREVQEWW